MKMKKRLKLSAMTVFFAMLLGFAVMSIGTEQAFAMEGNGSEENPYQISTYAELKEFANIVNGTNGATQNMSAFAELTANIECDDETWVPIGPASGYKGIFDGNGYEISNVTASSGLFSTVAEGGSVKNLTVKIVSVGTDDQEYVGGIANENSGTIESCTVECGNIKAKTTAAAVAGINKDNGTIKNCTVETGGDIQAKNAAGAVAGTNKDNGTIENCTAKIDGNIKTTSEANTGTRHSGGIVANNQSGTVKGCRAYGEGSIINVNGDGDCGGIAGWNSAKIESCICEGSLEIYNNEKDYSGGIAGCTGIINNAKIDDCLVYGDVEVGVVGSGKYVGGLVARMVGGTCSNSFYNSSKAPKKDAYPIVSNRQDGTITNCYYNTASGCTANGYGTEISDIYWLKCDSNITATIKAEDKKTFAGRDFVYSGKDVTLSYDGLLNTENNEIVTYKVNGEEIDGDSFKMPEQETSVEARVGIDISKLEDLANSTFYNGLGQSPGMAQCSSGRVEEGTDYTVTKYQDSKGQEITEPPTYADTYTVTIRGINNYAGNTTIKFLIAKAPLTIRPKDQTFTYNGKLQGPADVVYPETEVDEYVAYDKDGLQSNDFLSNITIDGQGKEADTYDLEPSAVNIQDGKGNQVTDNYDITLENGKLTIDKAKITITAEDKSSKAGEALKELTYKVSGAYVKGDELGVKLSTTANKSKAGTYAIKAAWNNNKNYKATLVNGKYTVTAVKPKPAPAPKVSGTLIAKATAKGKTSLAISWNRIKGAAGYDIFFAECNHGSEATACRKVKNIKGNKTFSWTKTGLDERTSYKAYIKAYVVKNGKKSYVRTSPVLHTYTGGYTRNFTSAKSVTVNKTKVTLKKGKAFKIKARVIKLKKNRQLMGKGHAPTLRYLTTNKKVATVSGSGRITAKGKGTCLVYVYAHNGVSKQIKVTVK